MRPITEYSDDYEEEHMKLTFNSDEVYSVYL